MSHRLEPAGGPVTVNPEAFHAFFEFLQEAHHHDPMSIDALILGSLGLIAVLFVYVVLADRWQARRRRRGIPAVPRTVDDGPLPIK